VAVIARRHGINANQVFAWRRQYPRGQLVEGSGAITQEPVVVPVRVAELSQVQASTGTAEPSPRACLAPRIEIELAKGPRLKIWDISSETLRALIRDLVRPC
jgi:transposase